MLDISAEYTYRGSVPSSAASFRLLIFELPTTEVAKFKWRSLSRCYAVGLGLSYSTYTAHYASPFLSSLQVYASWFQPRRSDVN